MGFKTRFPPGSGLDADKAALRAEALERRAQVPQDVRAAFAARLALEGVALAKRFDAKTASAFMPIGGEPDTLPLFRALYGAGISAALPVTVGRGSPLVFRRWAFGAATRLGQMKIPEPHPNAEIVEPDLLFTPLSAYDRAGGRIGYGMGHYDRSLRALRAKGRAIAVGVAFSVSEIPLAPFGDYDERLDFILTERELIEVAHR